jgi:hypothetical protein
MLSGGTALALATSLRQKDEAGYLVSGLSVLGAILMALLGIGLAVLGVAIINYGLSDNFMR